jgi:hypothetical protein
MQGIAPRARRRGGAAPAQCYGDACACDARLALPRIALRRHVATTDAAVAAAALLHHAPQTMRGRGHVWGGPAKWHVRVDREGDENGVEWGVAGMPDRHLLVHPARQLS